MHTAGYGKTNGGFTFTELIVVIVIISLFVALAQINLLDLLARNSLKNQAGELASTMQMAAFATAEGSGRYEIIVDLTEQRYTLRQVTSPELSQVLEEEIIKESDLRGDCMINYVLFDDGEFANEGRAKFRVGSSGWQYGGKIVLVEGHRQSYSVVVNRITRLVEAVEGDVEILAPRPPEEMFF
jgi:prepilin-type N-terminal cleavage/methylation domain-containing protein